MHEKQRKKLAAEREKERLKVSIKRSLSDSIFHRK